MNYLNNQFLGVVDGMTTKNEFVIDFNSKKLVSAGILLAMLLLLVYSYSMALFAFDAPSVDYPLQITQVDTLDNSNVSQSTFNKGDLLRFNTTIEKAVRYMNFPFSYEYFDFVGDTDTKLIVTVIDPNKLPVFIESNLVTVAAGEEYVFYTDYVISAGAASGVYSYTVTVWSDWLPSGNTFSLNVWEDVFNVS